MSYYVACRSCKGSGNFYPKSGKRLDCRACGGTGINQNLYQTKCERCRTNIIYKRGQTAPRFCRDCRNIQLEKRCAQSGCDRTIRYKVGWSNVPDYCKRCETNRQRGSTARRCPGTGFTTCGKLIWSPPGKDFRLCRECNEKERAKKAAQWKTKRCKNCGNEVRYHVDWKYVPDLCKSCKEAEKAKWKEKPCARCGKPVRYHVDWKHPPNICKDCKNKKPRASKSTWEYWKEHRGVKWHIKIISHSDGSRFDVYVSPNPDGYPHFHIFFPDRHPGSNEWAKLSWEYKGHHQNIEEVPAALQQYVLDLLANL